MIGCCRARRLDFQALRGEAWAAIVGKAKGSGGRSRLSSQAGIHSGQPREQQQRTRRLEKKATTLPAIGYQDLSSRLFSSDAKKGDADESERQRSSSPATAAPADSARPMAMGNRRRRAWERSLSPLERVSQLLPEEFLSPEIRAMRNSEAKESHPETCAKETGSSPFPAVLPQAESQLESMPTKLLSTPNKNVPFQVGDLILAEIRRRRHTEFKKLSQLTSTGVLNSSWGMIQYADIIGKLPGQMFRTSTGHVFLIRRPALEEFVTMMKRGPTISYPKDINAMLLLMDTSQGDTVLEVGSGSGGMSLFLSRAVGPQGRVISYEVRKDHYGVAKRNYKRWCDAWKIGHTVEWPDNVDFINEDIVMAAEDLKTVTFDSIALDMMTPQNALPVVFQNLKEGGICTVYLANITQVIDLLEAISLSKLTLFCERIIEVTHRDWLVLPATWKHCRFFQNMESKHNMDDESTWYNENDEVPAEESAGDDENDEVFVSDKAKPPYIARPFPWQIGHTAFLVKLRKFNPAHPNTDTNGNC
ncbi:tRNA (adenine(58)-N(1))-methyltransferase, mitochondrial isoform X2 [Hemicordylus capensis]|uniref:tRNA (adenine(58)-N(1))-methyltransferase, mitochondrial isoform X2 n=1 Tax=Hemicordylus capensis TaxID=884348 RepID=UPI0023041230|nr:tRNA (adenine(58)-N(1))-methyltransferase, mitochondrial isoform X2 [Hemicordylus capensis]